MYLAPLPFTTSKQPPAQSPHFGLFGRGKADQTNNNKGDSPSSGRNVLWVVDIRELLDPNLKFYRGQSDTELHPFAVEERESGIIWAYFCVAPNGQPSNHRQEALKNRFRENPEQLFEDMLEKDTDMIRVKGWRPSGRNFPDVDRYRLVAKLGGGYSCQEVTVLDARPNENG